MAKGCVFQIVEIGENIERLAGEEIRQKVMAGSEQITASSKPDVVAAWVKGAMERLDALVTEQAKDQIMVNCGHNCAIVNKTPIERAIFRRKKYPTLDEFLEAEQRKPPAGMRLSREENLLYQFYTPHTFTKPMRCYCSLFKGLPNDDFDAPF